MEQYRKLSDGKTNKKFECIKDRNVRLVIVSSEKVAALLGVKAWKRSCVRLWTKMSGTQ